MTAIEILMEEHRYIERMLKVMRKICFEVLEGKKVNYDDFDLIIDFVRNYADGQHHNKEEIFLFARMLEDLGLLGEKTIKYGMLVEHDYGRLYINNLNEALTKVKDGDEEAKLDLIANAISYTDLLKRHVDKEDNVIYKFALRELKADVVKVIDEECNAYESDKVSVKEKYLNILVELEKKYIG